MELKIIARISGGTRSNNLYFFAHVTLIYLPLLRGLDLVFILFYIL